MAFSAACCLHTHLPPPPPPNSISLPPTKTTPFIASGKRHRWAVGVASVVVALEMWNWVAGETCAGEVDSRNEITRWSDERRICPQWRRNSLETLVPEKLPRPSARRRWEAAGLSRTAPKLQATHGHGDAYGGVPNNQCFTM